MPEKLDEIHKSIVENLKGKTNPRTKKPYSEEEMWAIAQAQYKKTQDKENKFCPFGSLEIKEDDKDFHVAGFIATSHPDKAGNDGFEGDVIPKSTLQKIVDQINNRYNPQAGCVSESHDWLKSQDETLPLAGVIARNTPAELRQTPDNQWGVFVDTVLARSNPRYPDVKANVEQGVYPGFSIEYDDTEFVPTLVDGKQYRLLTDLELKGFGLANRRLIANPHAEIIEYGFKEVIEPAKKIIETNPKGETMEQKESKLEVSPEDFAKIEAIKSKEIEEATNKRIKELVELEMKEMLNKTAPSINTTPSVKTVKFKEVKHPYHDIQARMKEIDSPMGSNSMRAALHKQIVSMQYKEAARITNELMKAGVPIFQNWHNQSMSGELELKQRDLKLQEVGNRVEIKETRLHDIEMKAGEGLQVDTNVAHTSWTYGSYYQSPVELNDIYGQALINQLNDQTITWGKLTKQDWSGRSQIQIRARTGRNSTAAGYSEGANLTYGTSFTGNVGRQKFQQPYAYYRVLVAVTGQELQFAKAPGGIGDIWANEIENSGYDLMRALNLAIVGTGDGTSEATALGFEGLILGTTGTLYGRNIATYTTLKSHKESCSGRIDLDQLRKMMDYCQGADTTITNSNANKADLVFFTSFTQRRFILSLIQSAQRTYPTSARIGYEGELEVDGVPVFADPQINADDVFCIDTRNTKIGINLPPTIEALPVTADAKAAQVKIYFNLFSDAPSNNYWAYGFATS